MCNVRVSECELEEILSNCFAEDISIKYQDYKGLFIPDVYPLIAEAVENFEVRNDDVWVCSFPKTGTTWTQEMVWCVANNLDFEGAKLPVPNRFPFLEFSGSTTTGWISLRHPEKQLPDHLRKSVEYVNNMPSPRFIKSHLPFHLLPRQLRTGEKNCKIIYVARNPKDTCISFYHHYKMFEAYISTFENFCKLFLGGKVLFAPFWEHIIGYREKKTELDILFLKYEDMKKDLQSVIRKTATYLDKTLNDQQVDKLEEHLSFRSMKINRATNYEIIRESLSESKIFGDKFKIEGEFMRKGIVGQWKTSMPKEIIKQFDDWTREKLKNYPDLYEEFP